jgi:hypothetical protein
MPKIEPADERAGKLKVAVPAELLNRIAAIAERNGRSTTREVESRLRASLEGEEALTRESNVSSWARAIGRLMTALANDFAAGSKTPYEALAAMKAGATALMGTFLDEYRKTLGGQVDRVEANADAHAGNLGLLLARKVRHANEPENATFSLPQSWLWTTQASLRSLQPEELKEIQAALFLRPELLEPFRIEAQGKGKK